MPRPEDFMMTAEELRLRRLKRRRILIVSVALVLLLVAGYFGGRPGINVVKGWQARRHAANAFAYINKQNWTDARKEATAAYQLRPTEPQSLRAVARFLSRTRQPDALEFWRQLEKIAPLTREDRQDEAAVAIMAGETTRAETAVRTLLESKDVDPGSWLLAAQLSIQQGMADDAMSALRKIFTHPRATEQQQLQAALLELSLGSGTAGPDERATDAWSRIENISKGKSATALDALVLLAHRELSQPGGTGSVPSTSKKDDTEVVPPAGLSHALASHPLARAPQKLLSLDLVEHASPSRHDELIAEGIAQWKDGDSDDLLALATWLSGKTEFQKTLETIPLEKALLSRELFLQYVDALGGLGRWSEIKQLLESERYPLDPVVQLMYLARCNAQLGEKTAAENNWQRALESAGGDVSKLISLGDYAEKNGIVDVAQPAFSAAATEAPKLRAAQQGRLRIAQRGRDTKKIHAILADMLKIWPNDAAVQNDEGYTRLLLMSEQQAKVESKKEKVENAGEPITNNEELITISALAEKLVAKNPRSMPHRTLLALVHLKRNRPRDALAVYDNISLTRGALTPSALAVHAAVLAANGKDDDAKSEAKQIKPEQLLPEERELVESIK